MIDLTYFQNISSPSRRIAEINESDFEKIDFESAISRVTRCPLPEFENEAQARVAFGYSMTLTNPTIGMVNEKVLELAGKFPWIYKENQDINSSFNPTPVVKVKKVTDKDRVLSWWNDNLDSFQNLSPKEIQDRMSEELEIHRNSCRGLYYTAKKVYLL